MVAPAVPIVPGADSPEKSLAAEQAALRHNLTHLLCTLHRDLMAGTDKRTREAGITAAQWRFLRTLYIEDGLTQSELSRRVGLREPTTVRALAKLRELGLVEQQPVAGDRRKRHVLLTTLGRQRVTHLLPMVTDVNQVALAGRSPAEEQQLKQWLLAIIRNLQADLAR